MSNNIYNLAYEREVITFMYKFDVKIYLKLVDGISVMYL